MKTKNALKVIIVFLLVFSMLVPSKVQGAGWWDTSWVYRKPINITENSGSTLTDYQILVTVDTQSLISTIKMRSDCGDIRFIDSDDSTNLSYWIESGINTLSTKIWVKVPSISASSTKTIYMYYGNPSATSISNGTATFIFFDDFSGDLSKWTIEKTSGAYPLIENGYLVCGGGSTSGLYGHTSIGSSATYSGFQGGIIEGKLYLSTNAIGEIAFRGNYSNNTGYKSRADARGGQGISHLKPPYSGWDFLGSCPQSGTAIGTLAWKDFKVAVNGSSFTIKVDGQTKTCSDSSYTSAGEIALQNHYGSYTRYDDIRVRKFASSEPTTSIENEQVLITASAGSNGSILPSGAVVVNYGADQAFTITPDLHYHVADVLVDGLPVGAVTSYTFYNVTAAHTIVASFSIDTNTITASAGPNGSISPLGAVTVNYGADQTFTITPNTGYHIVDVKVDSVSQGAITSYTFTNVTSNHTIDATFEIDTFTITATAGTGGKIEPSGSVTVNYGGDKSFTIKANPGFMIFRILVDGSQITISNPFTITYTFSNVTSNHIIQAGFMKIPDITPPSLTLPKVGGIDLNLPGAQINTSSDIFTFTVEASDESGIARMVVKVNGVVQIDKNNLDPTIYLSEGVNNIDVTVYDASGNYTTKSFKVISDTKPPIINVDIPQTSTTQEITIKGIVFDSVTGVQSLTVNGNSVIPALAGEFETKLTLSSGANTITIEAIDKVGNKEIKTFTVSYFQPQAKQSYLITLKINDPDITVNGISKKIDAQGSKPIIKNGRTLLPIRTLIESLGGTISWDATEKKVTIELNGHSIILWIDKTTALVNGSKVKLDVAPIIINGRTYLPLRFISENLGASVDWDETTKTVTIYYWP